MATEEVHPFLQQLDRAIQLEVKYRGGIQPSSVTSGGAITSGMRDGSAHVLRCLKVWYDLPSDIFFNALSSIDRFLAKMKAQPKHLSCIAVSAFHLACQQYQQLQQLTTGVVITTPEPSDLVTISQSRCSPSDLHRMQKILADKLDLNPVAGPEQPVTTLEFLRLMSAVSRAASHKLGLGPELNLPDNIPDHLLHQLEILACDSLTLEYRQSEVALALLFTDFQRRADVQPEHANALMGFMTELQKYCNISSRNFVSCHGVVIQLLEKYNGECTVAHRQRLVWKLSNRTLRHLRPTDKLRPTLPTIKEAGQPNIQRISMFVRRSTSESSEESFESFSECDSDREMEVEDWNERTSVVLEN